MKKLLILLAVLVLLTCTAAAYEIPTDFTDRTLEDVVTEFREAHGLTEQNFSLCYYNTVTGEEYAFNDTWFSIAASTYKLPLNMYFYEMQQAGEITGDTKITWTGQTLDYIHEQSIVNSNNELSEALMYYWGDHVSYKQNMRKYFTMTDEEIHPSYWQANWYCTRMMMDCLKYLYEHQESFEELIGYMKQAMPGQYFQRGVPDYEVAHKYGSVQVYNNDVGIIYTPEPYLLAVYTLGGSTGGDGICAEAARLMTAYNLWQTEQTAAEPEEEEPEVVEMQVELVPKEEPELPVTEELPEEAPAPVPPEEASAVQETPIVQEPAVLPAEPVETAQKMPIWPVAVIGGTAVLLLLTVLRLAKKKKS